MASIPEYVMDPTKRYMLFVIAFVCGLFYMLVWAMPRRSVGDPAMNRIAAIVLKVMFAVGIVWRVVPDSTSKPPVRDSLAGPEAGKEVERGRALVGRWQHTDGLVVVNMEFRPDGVFFGNIVKAGHRYARFSGDWVLLDGTIRYYYRDSTRPGAPTGFRDVERVVRLDDRELVIKSGDGIDRRYYAIARQLE